MLKPVKTFMFIALGLVGLAGCNIFGDKTNLDFIPKPVNTLKPIEYVPIQPVITGFTAPVHICSGFDNMFYVVDSQEGIICLDQSGGRRGVFSIPGVTFNYVAQDRNLDLIALGKETIELPNSPGQFRRVSTIYRISLKDDQGGKTFLGIGYAKVVRKMNYPLFLNDPYKLRDKDLVESIDLNAVGFITGNQYYVTSSSTKATPNGSIYENNAVLQCFDIANEDKAAAWRQIPINDNGNFNFRFFQQPYGLVTLLQPPQAVNLPEGNSLDFIVTQNDPTLRINKILWITVTQDIGGTDYSIKKFQTGSTFYATDRYVKPMGLAYAGDGRRQVFVTDKDSVFVFTNQGRESFSPSAGTSANSIVKTSFGGTGTGLMQFNGARSVAYANKIVYVVDEGNKCIKRFKMTYDFE